MTNCHFLLIKENEWYRVERSGFRKGYSYEELISTLLSIVWKNKCTFVTYLDIKKAIGGLLLLADCYYWRTGISVDCCKNIIEAVYLCKVRLIDTMFNRRINDLSDCDILQIIFAFKSCRALTVDFFFYNHIDTRSKLND